MAKLIIFLDRIIYLYMYFIVGACVMSWIPNINPDYPFFHTIFTAAGFYIIPPVLGLGISPAVVMLVCCLLSMVLKKFYDKFYADKEPKVLVVTPEELVKTLKQQHDKFLNKEQEEKNDDSI